MSSEWKNVKLAEVINIIGGGTPKTTNAEYWNGNIPWLSVADFNDVPRWVDKTEKHISKLGLEQSSTKLLDVGDIIISARGTVGALAQLKLPMTFNQSCYGIRGIEGVSDNDFLFYALKVAVNQLKRHAHGGVFDTITRETFSTVDFDLPPLQEQIKIAKILGALDERITLAQKTNETLLKLLQTIFKSWFIDFEPVKENLEKNSHIASVASHFPDSLYESELGMIPFGWKVEQVGDVVETVGGATPDTKNESYWQPAIHSWTSPKDLSNISSPVLLATERRISENGLKKISSGLLPKGTLLMSSRAPIGYLAISQIPIAINQGYIAITPNGKLSPLYMLLWCQSNMENIKSRANGSTFMEISKKVFRPMPITVPTTDVLKAFDDVGGSLFNKIVENETQIQTLSSIRDTLLPRLLSGQLSVNDAELESLTV